jgi:hypothetical protein
MQNKESEVLLCIAAAMYKPDLLFECHSREKLLHEMEYRELVHKVEF